MTSKQLTRAAAAKHPKLIMEPFDEFYMAHGYDAVFDMIQLFGGATVHIPQMARVFKGPIETCAKNDWLNHCYSFYELARKYGHSERHWRRVILGA
jgi:Mor family transcriptional regulator